MGTNRRAEIAMTPAEVAAFIEQSRTATLATNGPSGAPHLVAMWYAVLHGSVWFETKLKSQKVVNLRRDPRVTCLIERGRTTDQLRGVALEGRAHVSDDPEDVFAVCRSVYERYMGVYDESRRAEVEAMTFKRVAVRVDVDRVRSWDHRKLGDPPAPLTGTTAAFVDD